MGPAESMGTIVRGLRSEFGREFADLEFDISDLESKRRKRKFQNV